MTSIPPPPAPPVITLDEDEKEEGEASDDAAAAETSNNNLVASKKSKKSKPSAFPDNDSDVEVVADDLYELDDGPSFSFNIDNEDDYLALQKAVGINKDSLDITINIAETPKNTRKMGTCFNCDGAHTLAECTFPHDKRKINRNRQSFGSTKRESRIMDKPTKFTPGKLSAAAHEALELRDDEYPQWIYRMRDEGIMHGYPPAWLKRLKPDERTLSFFTDDPILSEGVAKAEVKFDADKIVWYEGFNVIDRHCRAEKRINQNVRRDLRFPVRSKEDYARELQEFVERQNQLQKNENRKRQHDQSGNEPQKNKKARYDLATSTPTARPLDDRKSTPDTPASPTLPPVVSKTMTEDQAVPLDFLVPVVDSRRMPKTENFAKDITAFQYDNLAPRSGTYDKLEALLKSRKE